MENDKSEFGKGFTYNLFLFAKHYERLERYMKDFDSSGINGVEMWFNGAGDHFFEFELPDSLKETEIGKRFEILRNKVLEWRLAFGDNTSTKEDFNWVFEELEALCREVDKFLGVKAIKADYN